MTDVIIEARKFIALDMFKKILKSRLVDFRTSDDTSQNEGSIITSDYFLCSEKFEIEIGGQPKLLELARKFKAKNIYIIRENSDNFCLESDLGGNT